MAFCKLSMNLYYSPLVYYIMLAALVWTSTSTAKLLSFGRISHMELHNLGAHFNVSVSCLPSQHSLDWFTLCTLLVVHEFNFCWEDPSWVVDAVTMTVPSTPSRIRDRVTSLYSLQDHFPTITTQSSTILPFKLSESLAIFLYNGQ